MVSETKIPLTNEELETEETKSPVPETAAKAEVRKEEKEPLIKSGAETLSFKTQAELDVHIEKEATRRANSIANKSTAALQTQMEELKTNLRLAEQSASEKEEESALSRLENKQQELYGAEESLPDFLEAQRTLLQRARVLKKKEQDFQDNYSKVTTNVRQQQAFTKALELYLVPEDSEEFFTTVKAFTKKLAEAGSDREMELLYALEEEKLKRLAEAEPNTREARPDSALGTAPGGVDITKLDARELLRRGFAKELKR